MDSEGPIDESEQGNGSESHESSEAKRRKVTDPNGSTTDVKDTPKALKEDEVPLQDMTDVGHVPSEQDTTTLGEEMDNSEGAISGEDEFDDTAQLVNKKSSDKDRQGYQLPPMLTRLVRWSVPVLGVIAIVLLCIAAGLVMALNHSCSLFSDLPWWKTTVIYQIYPQSFQDSSGNGIGDLNGITRHLDYLEYLGVKAIWLNPIYSSPMADSGYDVSNYTAINPLFGTLDDFKQLLSAAHQKGIKLLMDFVPNHTSEEHPWFKESRSSLDNPKRQWYVWAPPSKSSTKGNPLPPNNWLSLFGGSMWKYDGTTKQYYLHQFSEQQPDLNFRNPEVLDALDGVLRFWLDLGVDGFRVDAIAHLFEDPLLRDEEMYPNQTNTSSYDSYRHNYTKDLPEIHDVVQRWRRLLDSYGEKVMIGESYSDLKTIMSLYGTEEKPEFSFPFNFFLLENAEWKGTSVAEIIQKWIDNQPKFGWPNWVLGNHDNNRIASKAGPERARLLNVLLLLLPGTPTTYYGEELGMEDVPVPKNLSRDTNTDHPRDQERTPMLWNNSVHSGFTSPEVKPWLPLPDKSVIAKFNVETQKADPKSTLNLYRQLVVLRSNLIFQHGMYKSLSSTEDTLVFLRYYKEGLKMSDKRYIVAINFSGNSTTVHANVKEFVDSGKLVLSSFMDTPESTRPTESIPLRPYEAVVIEGQSDKWI